MIIEKKCSRCKNIKNVSFFDKATKSKDGFQYLCRACHKEDYIKNKEKRSKLSKEKYSLNKEEKISLQKEWALKKSR